MRWAVWAGCTVLPPPAVITDIHFTYQWEDDAPSRRGGGKPPPTKQTQWTPHPLMWDQISPPLPTLVVSSRCLSLSVVYVCSRALQWQIKPSQDLWRCCACLNSTLWHCSTSHVYTAQYNSEWYTFKYTVSNCCSNVGGWSSLKEDSVLNTFTVLRMNICLLVISSVFLIIVIWDIETLWDIVNCLILKCTTVKTSTCCFFYIAVIDVSHWIETRPCMSLYHLGNMLK